MARANNVGLFTEPFDLRTRSKTLCVALTRGSAFDTAAPVPSGVQFASPDGRIALWLPVAPRVMQEDFPSRTGSPCQRTTYAGEASHALRLADVMINFHDYLKSWQALTSEPGLQ